MVGPTAKSLANLIPLNQRSPEDRKRIQLMGARAKKNTTNIKINNRLKKLRENGLNKESEKWLYDMMTDSELSAMHILEWISKLRNSKDIKDINMSVKTLMDWYKIKHGTKENDRKVAAIVIHLTPEEKEAEIIRLLK